MEKLSMCRICMAVDVRFHYNINTDLQDMYQTLTAIPFETKDQRSHQVCYICYAHLRNCCKLRATSLRSNKLFSEILNNTLDPALFKNTTTLKIAHPLILLSNIPDTVQEHNDVGVQYVKKEPIATTDSVTIKEEINAQDDDLNEADNICWEENCTDRSIQPISKQHFVAKTCILPQTKIERDAQSNTEVKFLESINGSTNIPIKRYQDESEYPTSDSDNKLIKIENLVPKFTSDLVQDVKLEQYIGTGVRITKEHEIRNSGSVYHNVHSTSLNRICPKILKVILHRIDDTKLCNPTSDVQEIVQVKEEPPNNSNKYDIERFQDQKAVSHLTTEKNYVKKDYSNQVSIHTDETQYKCDINKIFNCNVCKESFYNNITLSKHFINNMCKNLYKCDIREMQFSDNSYNTSKYSSRVSKQLVKCQLTEKNATNTKGSNNNTKLFKCDICEKTYTFKCNLIRHFGTHIGKSYVCDVCEKSFVRKCALKNHIGRHFGIITTRKRIKTYKCDICNKLFDNKYNLNMHTLVHTGERPFKCHICEKSFNHKGHLNVHIRIHTGERPFRCDYCDRSYSNQSHLINHVRKHTGEKPYECDICKKRYSKKSHLNVHVRTHADVKPYKCDICKKLYSTKESIRVHMRSQHTL